MSYYMVLFLSSVLLSTQASAQAPLCAGKSPVERLLASAKVLNIHIIGTDERQPEENFSKPENLEGQKILGRQEIKSISGIFPVECYFTEADGGIFSTKFNGVLICDHETVMINAHSLNPSFCEDTKNNFTCIIPKSPDHPKNQFFKKPEPSQIKASDVCGSINPDNDVAILKLKKPSKRTPLKIGTINAFDQIKGRKFVTVGANISGNFKNSNTKKTFMVSQFEKLDTSLTARSNSDSGHGSSGEPHLISQNGELLVIGILEGGYGDLDANHKAIDGRPYSVDSNYTSSLIFKDTNLQFLKKNIKNPEKCLREVRPENEVSI